MSWDESYHQKIGEINLKYLLSFGQIDEPFFSKCRYSTLYWTVLSLSIKCFLKFYLEVYLVKFFWPDDYSWL